MAAGASNAALDDEERLESLLPLLLAPMLLPLLTLPARDPSRSLLLGAIGTSAIVGLGLREACGDGGDAAGGISRYVTKVVAVEYAKWIAGASINPSSPVQWQMKITPSKSRRAAKVHADLMGCRHAKNDLAGLCSATLFSSFLVSLSLHLLYL